MKNKFTKYNAKEYRTKFLELKDPVGVKFAEKYLGGYMELERIMKFAWFKPYWDTWQKELRAILKSEALERIQAISAESSAQSLNAAKYLANGDYIEEGSAKRGRPSKDELSGELKRQVKLIDEIDQDIQRMTAGGLKVITGGRA